MEEGKPDLSEEQTSFLRRVVIVLGLTLLLGYCVLAFYNWQAAMFIVVMQIAINTGNTVNQLKKLNGIWTLGDLSD